jgi:hypothetical protein
MGPGNSRSTIWEVVGRGGGSVDTAGGDCGGGGGGGVCGGEGGQACGDTCGCIVARVVLMGGRVCLPPGHSGWTEDGARELTLNPKP